MGDAGTGDEPPADFLALDSPNEGEAGTLTCPFDGCDGVVCSTARECHAHVREWHSPPYACGGCGASFAAQPALARHVRATGHRGRAGAEDGGELRGREAEHGLEDRNDGRAPGSRGSPGQDREDEQAAATNGDEALLEASGGDYVMCLEPCCRRHLEGWTERRYEAHVKSHGHAAAVAEGAALRQRQLPAAELERQQADRRALRCGAAGCPLYGKRLSTSQSYYHHLQTRSHLFPGGFWLAPGGRHCTVRGCGQFGRAFGNEANFRRHAQSAQHLAAARGGLARRLLAAGPTAGGDDADGDGDGLGGELAEEASHASGPSTPTPTPSGRRSQELLERRSRRLEADVRRLQAQMDWLCRQL